MHPAVGATLGVVVFWLLGNGLAWIVSGSVLDPIAALVSSAFIFVIVYRRVSRHGT